MGVPVQGIDELGHLLVAPDAAEGSLGVEHVRGGPAQHHLRLLVVSVVALIKLRSKVFGVAQPLFGVEVAKGLGQLAIPSLCPC